MGIENPISAAWKNNNADTIEVSPNQLDVMVEKTIKIISAKKPELIFQDRNAILVTIVEKESDIPGFTKSRNPKSYLVCPLSEHYLHYCLSKYKIKFTKIKGNGKTIFCDPPSYFLRAILDLRKYSGIPLLIGVVPFPLVRSDGSILLEQGYDPATKHFYIPNGLKLNRDFNKKISKKDMETSLSRIKNIIKDIPFKSESSLSIYITFLLLIFIRPLLPSAPGLIITASASGTGKTMLMELIGIIAEGKRPTVYNLGDNPNEIQKTLFSILYEQNKFVFLDNIEVHLKGDSFCTLLISEVISQRLLKTNITAEVTTKIILVANGNNVIVVGDLCNRVLMCELDAGVERPEERFFNYDLRELVISKRAGIITDLLTILVGWINSDMPNQDISVFGRFEEWCKYVREPLVYLGMTDPCEDRKIHLDNDPDARDSKIILSELSSFYDDQPFKVKDLIQELEREPLHPGLEGTQEALLNRCCTPSGKLCRRRIGSYFSMKLSGVVKDNRTMERHGLSGNVVQWIIKYV